MRALHDAPAARRAACDADVDIAHDGVMLRLAVRTRNDTVAARADPHGPGSAFPTRKHLRLENGSILGASGLDIGGADSLEFLGHQMLLHDQYNCL